MAKVCSLQGYVDGDWRTCFQGLPQECEAEMAYQIELDHANGWDFEYRIIEEEIQL